MGEEIRVGTLVTRCVGTDRYPYEVIHISDDLNTISIRQMSVEKGIDYDYYNNQVYTYFPNEREYTIQLTLRKNGKYVEIGQSMKNPTHYIFGKAQMYLDPSF